MPSFWPALSVLTLLPATISAVTFGCEHIQVDKQSFDLHHLGGPKSVHFLSSSPPSISNTTFTIDICDALVRDKKLPNEEQCSSNTRVCAIERQYEGNVSIVSKVVDIAGDYTVTGHGGPLDPEITRLKNSDSHGDSEREGLRVVLNGGRYTHDGKTEKQKAIIEFICDRNVSGSEGFDAEQQTVDSTMFSSMGKREDGEDDGDNEQPELPDLDKGKSLQFVDYKLEGDDVRVLRLDWRTKYACEGIKDDSPAEDKKGGWGFFTWFLIIVFLLVATYIIFGSWLNYNRYGARGWDLIPHGDAIRDLPYIIKDGIANITERFRGSGESRGGYSAV